VLCADRAIHENETRPPGGVSMLEWNVTASPARGAAADGSLIAFSTADGSRLWSCGAALGYNSPPDVFVADGLVWVGAVSNLGQGAFTEGRNLRTGEVERRLDTDAAFTETHHHRCYRNKATDNYILLGRTGVEFISLTDEKPLRNNWIRGACQYGVMPSNGLLYLPPHSCACYIQSKLTGFHALGPASPSREVLAEVMEENRLERGPAYGAAGLMDGALDAALDWPTYRHDPQRSGHADVVIPAKLQRRWQVSVPGKLTAPVAANGMVCVASTDLHSVHALDGSNGTILWSFTAGGRIDSAPTLEGGLVLFGCADGWVYCLRQSDGALVWRYLAAPEERHIFSFGQLESVWPVTGSVLVRDGVVYCTAGRSSYLDGGMWLCRLDAATGRSLGRKRLYSRDPETGEQPEGRIFDTEQPGALPDVLKCDDENLYLRDMRMDWDGTELAPTVKHLYSPTGYLEDKWWHRTYWIFGTQTFGRAAGWSVVAGHVPSGRILATDGESIYGYGRENVSSHGLGLKDATMHLFKASREVKARNKPIKRNNNVALNARLVPSEVQYDWSREIPVVARAMALTKEAIVFAGPRFDQGKGDEEPEFKLGEPAALTVVDAGDGSTLQSYELDAQPVFDGLIVARGRVYLSSVAGTVECWGDSEL